MIKNSIKHAGMTDLEITKLCAEAMGIHALEWAGRIYPDGKNHYDPLRDDAQAMALVKKFRLDIRNMVSNRVWDKSDLPSMAHLGGPLSWSVMEAQPDAKLSGEDTDLNRAICECVAKMQARTTIPLVGKS